jgi:hypothetical protein
MEILWAFDGRDVADKDFLIQLRQGEHLDPCPYCGTLRHPQLPFSCELDSLATAGITSLPSPSSRQSG